MCTMHYALGYMISHELHVKLSKYIYRYTYILQVATYALKKNLRY